MEKPYKLFKTLDSLFINSNQNKIVSSILLTI